MMQQWTLSTTTVARCFLCTVQVEVERYLFATPSLPQSGHRVILHCVLHLQALLHCCLKEAILRTPGSTTDATVSRIADHTCMRFFGIPRSSYGMRSQCSTSMPSI